MRPEERGECLSVCWDSTSASSILEYRAERPSAPPPFGERTCSGDLSIVESLGGPLTQSAFHRKFSSKVWFAIPISNSPHLSSLRRNRLNYNQAAVQSATNKSRAPFQRPAFPFSPSSIGISSPDGIPPCARAHRVKFSPSPARSSIFCVEVSSKPNKLLPRRRITCVKAYHQAIALFAASLNNIMEGLSHRPAQ